MKTIICHSCSEEIQKDKAVSMDESHDIFFCQDCYDHELEEHNGEKEL